jgi:hypothetical protein
MKRRYTLYNWFDHRNYRTCCLLQVENNAKDVLPSVSQVLLDNSEEGHDEVEEGLGDRDPYEGD